MHTINAVKRVAGYNEQTNVYEKASVAVKLGHSLTKSQYLLRAIPPSLEMKRQEKLRKASNSCISPDGPNTFLQQPGKHLRKPSGIPHNCFHSLKMLSVFMCILTSKRKCITDSCQHSHHLSIGQTGQGHINSGYAF